MPRHSYLAKTLKNLKNHGKKVEKVYAYILAKVIELYELTLS